MIHEIDEAIERLVRHEVLEGSGAEVVFDAPTKEWASRRNTPTVNVYLYDIREDPSKRHVGGLRRRDEQGVVTSIQEPPRYFRLAYLVTAWTQRPEDEHRLLASMLYAFATHNILPDEYRTGSLADSTLPVLIEVGRPLAETRQISEVWSALGGELKPSLDVMVTAPIAPVPVPVTAPPPDAVTIRTSGADGEQSEMRRERPRRAPTSSDGHPDAGKAPEAAGERRGAGGAGSASGRR